MTVMAVVQNWQRRQRFVKSILILYQYIIYFSLMFDDNDYFLSFGEKRHFVQMQSYLCKTIF